MLLRAALCLLLAPTHGFQLAALRSNPSRRTTNVMLAAITDINSQAEFDEAMNDCRDGVAIVSFTTEKGLRLDRGVETLSDAYDYDLYKFYKVVGDRNEETKALLDTLMVTPGVPTIYLYKNGAKRAMKSGGGFDSVELTEAIEDLRWEDGGGWDEVKKPSEGPDGRIFG